MKKLVTILALPLLATVLCLPGTAAAQDCGTPCYTCPPTKKICVPEVKKNTKTVYNSVCKDFCLPKCTFCGLFGGHHGGCGDCGGCDGCAEGQCGKPRTRNVLVKKSAPTCDTYTCVVQEVLCEAPCSAPCGTVIYGQPTMAAPGTEKAPMPAPK